MKYIRLFNELNKNDTELAGGKGASLGEMTQAGIPVPPGYVILTAAFDRFLEETDLSQEIRSQLDKVNHHEMGSVEEASKTVQALILNIEMPDDIKAEVFDAFKILGTEFVAVRSSATAEDGTNASWAGELDSFLNTTEETLLENVRRCWASLFTPRAIFYRFEKGFHKGKVSVAVVVQKMVNSEISGIAFSVHPVTEDPNQLIIEAGYGLGEAIVSGSVTPDNFVVDKRDWSLTDSYIANQERKLVTKSGGGNEWVEVSPDEREKQKLSHEKIIELSRLVVQIERHYGFPCDIEWAMEDNELFIVQSRPITTLSNDNIQSDSVRLPNFFYSLEEFATRPMTLQRDELGGVMWSNYNGRFVSIPLDSQSRALYIEHTDAEKCYQLLFKEMIDPERWQQHLDEYTTIVSKLAHIRQALSGSSALSLSSTANIYSEWLATFKQLGKSLLAPFAVERYVDPYCRQLLKDKVGNDSDKDFAIISSPSELNEYQKMRLELLDAVIGGTLEEPIFEKLAREYGWYNEYSFVEPLLDKAFFMEEAKKLSIGEAQIEKDKIISTIEENRSAFDSMIKRYEDPELKHIAKVLHTYIFLRTDRIDHMKKTQVAIRTILTRIANELTLKSGSEWTAVMVANCLNEELLNFMQNGTIPTPTDIEKRVSQNYIYYFEDNTPYILYGKEEIEKVRGIIESDMTQNEKIQGTIAFKGRVVGKVALVYGKADLPKVLEGDVLVASTTMPDYTPAMQRAVAFITAEGGITSHAAIVARELKRPCIVGTGNCMKLLKDGDLVEVDADNGVVKLIN